MIRSIVLLLAIILAIVIAPDTDAATGSLWLSTDGPTNTGGSDRQSVELGTRFYSDVDGQITGLRFYKVSTSTGTHIGNLWTNTGTLLTSVTYSGESASGWQQVNLNSPVNISANVSYIVSFHTVGYISTQHYFDSPRNMSPLHAQVNAGVYTYGSGNSLFPSSTYLGSNYWSDVVFSSVPPATATPTPTASSTPTATDTPPPGSTSTPTSVATSTSTPVPPTSTPTPIAPTPTPNPAGFTCTEVVGFSVTNSWYTNGFIQSVPDPQRWQLRWWSGGSIDQWAAGSAFSGWTDSNNLITHCSSGSSAPDRVVINISGDFNTDPNWWMNETKQVINYVKATYSPGVRVIVLQPPVGGPSSSLCPTTDNTISYPWVRATYNFPFIIQAIQMLSNGSSIQQGPYTEVRSCADYNNTNGDSAGHINASAQQAVGQYIANWYSQSR